MTSVSPTLQNSIARVTTFIFLFAALLLITSQSFAQSTTSKNPNSTLWKISGNGLNGPSYLFGTYDLVNSGYLPTDGKVLKAFRSAKGLVIEFEVDSSKLGLIGSYATMPGNSLSKLLTEEEYKLVDQEIQTQTRQPLEVMDQQKPTNLVVFLMLTYANSVAPELLQYQGMRFTAYFTEEALKAKKSLHSFETMTGQLDMLYNSQPLEKQAENLVAFVKAKKQVVEACTELIDLYKKENINEMGRVNEKVAPYYGNMVDMIDKRNSNWMEKLPGLMSQKSMFVAVDVAHLPGDNGLLKLLQKQGYTVEPVH